MPKRLLPRRPLPRGRLRRRLRRPLSGLHRPPPSSSAPPPRRPLRRFRPVPCGPRLRPRQPRRRQRSLRRLRRPSGLKDWTLRPWPPCRSRWTCRPEPC
ncbi:MAG: hypothetical protein B7Y85_01945 [Brevundimonas sp. 32-68-21]|nr:MAG: hypothetical protein B7Y85_01945 [Brevundimonas sp. 32-68-21]